MASTSPVPRRISTPRWLDLRLVLGVVLVVGAVLAGAAVVSRASDTRATVAAAHSLAAGTVLHASDLTVDKVQLPASGRQAYLGQLSDAVGKTLDRPLARGELVPAAAVAAVRATTTVTVPFAAAAAPDLRTGQRIKVWVSSGSCASVVLLTDVTVQSVRHASASLGSTSDGQDVVISVDPTQADRVVSALAIDGAQIRAGVLTGPVTSPSPAPAPASDVGDGRLPADLAACASPTAGR